MASLISVFGEVANPGAIIKTFTIGTGGVTKGDIVSLTDTSGDGVATLVSATAADVTTPCGVALETVAQAGTGRILISGQVTVKAGEAIAKGEMVSAVGLATAVGGVYAEVLSYNASTHPGILGQALTNSADNAAVVVNVLPNMLVTVTGT